MALPLFDTHAHLIADDWTRYPARPLAPNLPTPTPPDYSVTGDALIAMMDEQDVKSACLVQRGHVYGFDNSYIIDSARRYPGRLHPVVILDPQDPATPQIYRDMVRDDGVRGFRMAQSRPHLLDTAWISSPAAMDVWKACADLGTPVTLIVFMNHLSFTLPLIKIIAGMFPDLPILLDHGAMPFGMTQFEVGIAKAEGRPIVMPRPPHFGIDGTIGIFEDVRNVHFKITEINMERLAAENIRSAHIVRRLVDGFGPDRVMWGSDIGQSMLWSYAEKTAMARAATDFLTETEAHNLLHDNAARVYGATGA
ncbi:amidohydrolase [Sphingomonas sp.]|uniref:amidohydrolase family protein n=1 Tax=Sphingomonas sp. TaxID=28214 RepID=UPI000DB52252|nr:amidohydrolase family protein [Sphingomonas sp.]PZU06126.1 MAG: amidohydrolase [Sphingomonas sp.]